MSIENNKNLNHLLKNWPNGLILTSGCLNEKGYSYQLVSKYVKSHWLKSVARGAYTKLNDVPSLYGVLSALHSQLGLNIHLGGLSALEYYGLNHYLSFSSEDTYQIYNDAASISTMPLWLSELFLKIEHVNKSLFLDDTGVISKKIDGVDFRVSRPERAILELLAVVPNAFSIQFASDNLESLQLLDDNLVQQLLEKCLSIKIKRLFLYLAEVCSLPCFDKLNISSVDLGSGKRVIGEGGVYIPKYKISVPKTDSDAEIPDV